ncbi:MAG: aspartate-semialdehyde dehydrogenase [Candidatus Dormibacterales bacterium]
MHGEGGLRVAVVGATGLVGTEMLKVLHQREFPATGVRAIASDRSAGRPVAFDGASLEVEPIGPGAFEGLDLCLFAAGADVALEHAPAAARAGALVVDNSSAWRMIDGVPLVVPEVNAEDIRFGDGIIANPNCSTIQLAVVLEPIRRIAGLERVTVATYQSASGYGRELVGELEEQLRALGSGRAPEANVYPHQLANNVVPGGWQAGADGYSEEEWKIMRETRKILHLPDLRVTATCVRVPVSVGHGEAVFLETSESLSPDAAREALRAAPGVVVQDDYAAQEYPLPDAARGRDEVFVGRIRQDHSSPRGLALWVVADNLRKGAALNAVQIAERAIEMEVLRA